MTAPRTISNPLLLILCLLCLSIGVPSTGFSAELTIGWTKPDSSRVAGYNIYYGESGTDFKATANQSIDSPDTNRCTISGLADGLTYAFAVTSVDANGQESNFSETITYKVPPQSTAADADGDGYSVDAGDCDDTDASVFPGAIEICGDGIDQDCNGSDLSCTDEPAEPEETEDAPKDTTEDTTEDTEDTSNTDEGDDKPDNLDGNRDGTPDTGQANVASFQIPDASDYITLESAPGSTLQNCRAITPLPDNRPSDAVFEWGFFEFTISGIEKGASTQLMIYLPENAEPAEYMKYGPTPKNTAEHWYAFNDDGETGASINGSIITLYFKDGARGDDDLTADGTIIDAGGPIYTSGTSSAEDNGSTSTSESDDGGGGGGGCFIKTIGPFR